MSSTPVPSVDLVFRAFADRTRLRILHLLKAAGESCAGDVVATLGERQAKVSRHLAYLRRAGLIAARRDGTWIHYSIAPPRTAFQKTLLHCVGQCFDVVPEFRGDQKRLRRRRKAGCCPD
jgi:ArsR family transcriptional regulator